MHHLPPDQLADKAAGYAKRGHTEGIALVPPDGLGLALDEAVAAASLVPE